MSVFVCVAIDNELYTLKIQKRAMKQSKIDGPLWFLEEISDLISLLYS